MKTSGSVARLGVLVLLAAAAVAVARGQTNETDSNGAAAVAAPTNSAAAATAVTNAASKADTNAAAAQPAPAPAPDSESAAAPEPAPGNAPARTGAPAKLDFASFRVISERNIFDGKRSGQRITSTRSSSQQRSVRVESFALVGTLLGGSEPVAFFDGTDSEFRKALHAGGGIAGFRIKEILPAGVRLEEGTNSLDLPVGAGFRREDAGPWKSAVGGSYASSGGGSSSRSSSGSDRRSYDRGGRNGRDRGGSSARTDSSSSTESNADTSAPPPGEVNDILKRLMEKRDKE
jgi:hypothetical protein